MNSQRTISGVLRSLALVVPITLAACTEAQPFVLVSNHEGGNSVAQFTVDGEYLGNIVPVGAGGLLRATGLRQIANGDLLVASEGSGAILLFDMPEGAFISRFAEAPAGSTTSYFDFGPNGDVYSSDPTANLVHRYDATTGEHLGVGASGGGLSGADGLFFLDDDTIIVSSYFTGHIKQYDIDTGTYVGDFATGVPFPLEIIASHAPGELLAVSQGLNGVVRLNAETGAVLGTFASNNGLLNPVGITSLPSGNYLVSSYSNSSIVEFDTDGNFVRIFAAGLADGLQSPTNMLVVDQLPVGCPADVASSGTVDSVDLAVLLAAWGSGEIDLDQDGTTGSSDLAMLLAAWGECP